jgi:hypothetical protein
MMDLDDSPLLHEPDLMLAVLRVAAAKSGTLDDCIGYLRMLRTCARVAQKIPEAEVRARLQAAQVKLRRARLIEAPASGRLRITARGRQVLADNSDGVDDTVLMQLPEFRSANGHTVAHRTRREVPAAAQPLDSEYQRGFEAFVAGFSLADNPHPRDVRSHLDWENGWSQARDEQFRQQIRSELERRLPGAAGTRRGNARASDR